MTPSKFEDAKFYPAGSEVLVDLDGDGEDETIEYTVTDLTVNGVSLQEFVGNTAFNNEPIPEHFVIADINTADLSKQIGILTAGPSSVYEPFFYDYRPEYFRELGRVPAYMEDPSEAFDGKGFIYAEKRLSLLQTWFAPARWKLEGEIIDAPYDIYYPVIYPFMETVTLKVELPIYQERHDVEPKEKLQPQEVEFIATDNMN